MMKYNFVRLWECVPDVRLLRDNKAHETAETFMVRVNNAVFRERQSSTRDSQEPNALAPFIPFRFL